MSPDPIQPDQRPRTAEELLKLLLRIEAATFEEDCPTMATCRLSDSELTSLVRHGLVVVVTDGGAKAVNLTDAGFAFLLACPPGGATPSRKPSMAKIRRWIEARGHRAGS